LSGGVSAAFVRWSSASSDADSRTSDEQDGCAAAGRQRADGVGLTLGRLNLPKDPHHPPPSVWIHRQDVDDAGWVWAEKGYVGYGGFRIQNNGILGNFLFRRPADKPVPSRADL
jgi:hypothetical protein